MNPSHLCRFPKAEGHLRPYQTHNHDGAFMEIVNQLLAMNYFQKETSSYMVFLRS